MHITDPIADMLTRIRNANNAKHDTVDVPASNMKKAIAQILLEGAGNRGVYDPSVITEYQFFIRFSSVYGGN